MAQIILPVADTDAASWTATPLWSKVDDDSTVNPDGDGTTITHSAVGGGGGGAGTVAVLDLDSAVGDPGVSTGHIIRGRWATNHNAGEIVFTLTLRQGTTTIATLTTGSITGQTLVTSTYTLSGAEADAITDYSDLNFTLQHDGKRSPVVEYVEFETPDATVADSQASVSHAELEAPGVDRTAQVSYAELEAPIFVDAPGDLKPESMIALYDARNLAGADTDPVSAWSDESQNQQPDLAQATGTKQPLIDDSGFGGVRSVLFDGTDDILSSTFNSTHTGDLAIIVVLELLDYPTGTTVAIYSTGGVPNKHLIGVDDTRTPPGWVVMSGDGGQDEHYTGTNDLTALQNVPSRYSTMELIEKATDRLRLYENGAVAIDEEPATDDPDGLNDINGFNIGGREDDSRHANVRVGYIGVVDMTNETETTLLSANTELQTEFNVTAASPDREGQVSHAELETADAPRQGEVSWAELETGDGPREGQVSYAEVEVPTAPRTGQTSWAELEAPNAPRSGQVSWTEFETADAPREGQLSYAELEAPTAPREGQISHAELETADAPREGQVSYAELEAPTAPRQGQLSVASLETPDAPSNDRRGQLSVAELEVPTAPRSGQISHVALEADDAPRSSNVSWAELEIPTAPRTAQVSQAEVETSDAPRQGQVSYAELEATDAPRTGQLSHAELEVPESLKSAQVSYALFETPDAPSTDRRGSLSYAELETPTPPRSAQLSHAELGVPEASRTAQISHAEAEVGTAPRTAQLSVASLETPLAPRTGQLSHAEMETADAPRVAQLSYAEMGVGTAPREAQVSHAEVETTDAPRQAQISVAYGDFPNPLNETAAEISYAEFEAPSYTFGYHKKNADGTSKEPRVSYKREQRALERAAVRHLEDHTNKRKPAPK